MMMDARPGRRAIGVLLKQVTKGARGGCDFRARGDFLPGTCGGGRGQRGLRGEGGRRTPSCFVIPANAGTQSVRRLIPPWVPAFAGMTMVGVEASALTSPPDDVRTDSVSSRSGRRTEERQGGKEGE